jgi:hypothetical protein
VKFIYFLNKNPLRYRVAKAGPNSENVWGVAVKPKTYEGELELAEQLLVVD